LGEKGQLFRELDRERYVGQFRNEEANVRSAQGPSTTGAGENVKTKQNGS